MASPGREHAPGEAVLVQVRPPSTISLRLGQALERLAETSSFVGGAVSRRDGQVIHHTFRTAGDAATLCATATMVVGASRLAGNRLDEGGFLHGIVQYGSGTLVVAEAGPEAVVACVLARDANLGHALLMIRAVADEVERILAEL